MRIMSLGIVLGLALSLYREYLVIKSKIKWLIYYNLFWNIYMSFRQILHFQNYSFYQDI